MNTLGLYIHVPFCLKKCNYCDFYSVPQSNALMDKFTEGILSDIKKHRELLNNKRVDTVYFGGGTPSLLGTERIATILDCIDSNSNLSDDCEITLEANPATTDQLNLTALHKKGINRISLGMQTIHSKELRCLGRAHIHEDVIKSINDIRTAGITNISLDVMLGIPMQTEASLKETLKFCCDQDVPHISTYMLKIEQGTPFASNREGYIFADEDTQADLYEFTSEFLINNGYRHYEISNFCKGDMLSKHNMKYWQLKDYLGLGPSAHSMIDSKRFYTPRSFEDFFNSEIIQDGNGKTAEEFLMLSLRTDKGFVFSDFEKMFNKAVPCSVINEAKALEKHGLTSVTSESIKLTEKGFLVSNSIISALLNREI